MFAITVCRVLFIRAGLGPRTAGQHAACADSFALIAQAARQYGRQASRSRDQNDFHYHTSLATDSGRKS